MVWNLWIGTFGFTKENILLPPDFIPRRSLNSEVCFNDDFPLHSHRTSIRRRTFLIDKYRIFLKQFVQEEAMTFNCLIPKIHWESLCLNNQYCRLRSKSSQCHKKTLNCRKQRCQRGRKCWKRQRKIAVSSVFSQAAARNLRIERLLGFRRKSTSHWNKIPLSLGWIFFSDNNLKQCAFHGSRSYFSLHCFGQTFLLHILLYIEVSAVSKIQFSVHTPPRFPIGSTTTKMPRASFIPITTVRFMPARIVRIVDTNRLDSKHELPAIS